MSTSEKKLLFKPPQKSVEVNWSELPSDLLQTISNKLHDICDFIHFRSVCTSWYTSTSIHHLPPQIPWFLSDVNDDDGKLYFYSIFSDKMRTIHCPQARWRGICGPSHGYLYTCEVIPKGDVKHSFLNPLTKDKVALQFTEKLHKYVLLSMPPTLINDDDYMVFENGDAKRIEFYQPHKPKHNFSIGKPCCPQDTRAGGGCLKGMYFMPHIDTCETKVYNIVEGYSFVIPLPKQYNNDDKVIFVDLEGKILMIIKYWKNWDFKSKVSNGYIFDIYQLDVEDEIRRKYRWVKINSIGNYVLFLDCLWLNSGIFIKATESTRLRGNSIYHIVRHDYTNYRWIDGIYRYDINNGQSEKIPCPYRRYWTWFVPSLDSFPSSS